MNREYKRINQEWLETKSKEDGINALGHGVFYQVLKHGDPSSDTPSPRSIITVHYTGWTIDGKKFDGSRGETPLAIRLSDLIDGWKIALQQMHIGDQWEIYIPSELGYGKFSQPGIPGNSTLIFVIELLAIG